ncbi:MAG: hypothetical protein OEY64_03330 [Nitrospinota bacterium]|nr:hypothetical protein [Nitrospinota bacterium]
MPRTLTTAVKTALASGNINLFHFVSLAFSTTIYYTTAPFSISWNGVTWVASGNILRLPDITEELELRVGSCELVLSGVNTDNIGLMLSEKFLDREAVIYRFLLDSNNAVIADPWIHFKGRISTWSLAEDSSSGSSLLSLDLASALANFEQVGGRRGNHEDQQIVDPGDEGYKDADHQVAIPWGRG